jgi:phospholipase A1/A2
MNVGLRSHREDVLFLLALLIPARFAGARCVESDRRRAASKIVREGRSFSAPAHDPAANPGHTRVAAAQRASDWPALLPGGIGPMRSRPRPSLVAVAGLIAGLSGPARPADPVSSEHCAAQGFEQCIQWCREHYPGQQQREQRFACFDAAEQPRARGVAANPPTDASAAAAAPSPEPPTANAAQRPRTAQQGLWEPSSEGGFKAYRQSYVLFTQTEQPNDQPTSPNPNNRVAAPGRLHRGEAKFQFSFKAPVVSKGLLGAANSLWFGYTQQSYWQILDAANSRPFRESNYEPELIFSHRFAQPEAPVYGLRPLFLNFGAVHQSNGQSEPRSRSWNRVYAQLGMVGRLGDERSYALLARPWFRIRESPDSDDNPDVGRYLGHGDLELLFWSGRESFSLQARIRSLQADLSMPVPLIGGRRGNQSLQLHLQLFTGYGESLIDYNQRHTTFGLGFSVPYGSQ